ncbi:MAG: hypothetical protein ACQEVA_16635 [Myxococcota bacterium]
MSYSFYIEASSAPSWRSLVGALDYDDIGVVERDQIPEDDRFPKDDYFHVYRQGLSTRTVEIGWDGEDLSVRLMSCSSPEDYRMGIELARLAAEELGGRIRSEEGHELEVEEFDEVFDDAWVDDMVGSAPTALHAMVKDDGETLTIPGPTGMFFLGPKTVARLEEKEGTFVEAMLQAMRDTHWVDPNNWFKASIMAMVDEETGDEKTLTVWGPGVNYAFPAVDQVAIVQATDGDDFLIPYSAVSELAPSHYFLDERQIKVPAIDESDWPQFVEKAREYQVGEL